MNKVEKLVKKHNELYEELTETLTTRRQFTLLNQLLDIEVLLERERKKK